MQSADRIFMENGFPQRSPETSISQESLLPMKHLSHSDLGITEHSMRPAINLNPMMPAINPRSQSKEDVIRVAKMYFSGRRIEVVHQPVRGVLIPKLHKD